jgi:hypothetical protein
MGTMTLGPAAIRAAGEFTMDNPGRFALHGIRLEPSGRLVGCNGRALILLDPENMDAPDVALSEPMILPTDPTLRQWVRFTGGDL